MKNGGDFLLYERTMIHASRGNRSLEAKREKKQAEEEARLAWEAREATLRAKADEEAARA